MASFLLPPPLPDAVLFPGDEEGGGDGGVERIGLRTLIDHDRSVERSVTVGEVYRLFQVSRLAYLVVVDGGQPVGLCSRAQVGFLLGSQYGFSLYAKQSIDRHLLPRFLAFAAGEPIRDVLDAGLGRLGDDFHHDVAVVDAEGFFLGAIGIQTLVRVQSSLVREQVEGLARQRKSLAANNRELFRSVIELRQAEARHRTLFENSTVGIALLDASGGIETANQSLAMWLGGGTGSFLDAFEEGDRPRLAAALRASGGGHHASAEGWLRARDGMRRLLRVELRAIEETGQICACCADATQERAFTRSAVQREKQVFLDSLVGGIAHELNNKIHPIIGFADLLRSDDDLDAPTRLHYADVISKSSHDCARIVRQLLQFCRPAREEKVGCDLRALAEETSAFLHFRIREKRATLLADLGSVPVPVLADPAQVKQVLLNLIVNALDAMEERPVRELRLTLDAFGGRARLRVADTGSGIDPAALGRIFDPFFTTKPQDKGTGLGLSVCQAIVKAHLGEIAVESEPGRGAAFTVLLPLHAAASAAAAPEKVAASPDLPGRELRALVIDDEPFVGAFVQEVLKRRIGCAVERAMNGREAVAKLAEGRFDLVVCDVLMPVMNGVEVMRWIRANQPARLDGFLFVTGHDGGGEIAAEIATQRMPVLRKPFTADSLHERILALPALAESAAAACA